MLQRTDETAATLAEQASRGPRYTSYPPATEFGPIDRDAVRAELQRISTGAEPVSLYVHIPFCRSLCAYCGCNVIPTRDCTRGEAYVDQVATEMVLVAGRGFEAPVAEIALGGGSPNFLAPDSLRALVGALERYFPIAPGARRSIELDPRSTSAAQIETLATLGFRACSLGVQDLAKPVQDAIRRHQSVQETRWLVERARAAGFDDVNIDMVYGLPRQTEDSFTATLDSVIALAPDRIALFGYAHLPSKLPHQKLVERAGRVLDPYERASLLLLAIERLSAAGYLHLGLDHFAKPGSRLARAAAEHRMVRTFQGYVEHQADTILGMGVSAISSTPRLFWQNHAELAPWQADLVGQRLPIERGVALDDDDRTRAAVIGELMTYGRVELGRLGAAHGVDPDSYFASELAALAGLGELARYDAATRTIDTTDLGRLLVRNVCMVFDRYHRPAAQARFSSTI
jgi:oxygen-independent coproporphyrinogen III oxidase